ncbi:DEAD/DEAH box helicase [Aeromonas caviae]|uniref:DEAD/DEAH box helicase n=1 Tax=Aeromonas TaxID=642 RepID=UPI00148AFC27|nr:MULTISPECIES: DEAD/DEAH box helicase [Aeromonas]MCU7794662.1 DEAD/DEAH box helicase [Aeromonas caviae]QJT27085.1 DEAD/DEAH box helicase [Aeromonas media]WAF61511.1 DEAD/DEAH box helicase [Aeromonas caviae]WAF65573.1 DEAD/DEAH box helicase [Aeromonas caviae]WAF82399.1 DEAD/DEAH box helicase [Aeromonas caviae]
MSAFTLSSDCHALLCELQLQRAASTRYLQDTLHGQHSLTDTLNRLERLGLIRQRTEQQWSLTAEGTLTLILAVRSGACPMPDWRRVPSVTGQEVAQGVVRELCLGEAGQIPAYYQSAELLSLLDLPDAHRLLPGSSPAWQTLLLEHFALQTLLDAEPEASWPLASLVTPCAPALAARVEVLATEWEWLCGPLTGEVTTHWPSLQQLAEREDEQPLAERLQRALGQWQVQEGAGSWPRMFSALLWLGWLQQADPVQGSEQRKKWQRSLGNGSPLLADLLGQWAGDRHGQAVGLFDTLQLPLEELHWGYLWLDLCALARHGEQSPQVTILHKWDLSHLQEAEPRHRLMAFCQDLLRLLLGQGAVRAPLHSLRASPLDEDEEGAQGEEGKAPASASWLNWLQGLGRSSGVRKPQERLVWLLHAEGPELECKIQKQSTKGEWTAGRRVDPALLSTQYANLLDEADWALVRTLQRNMGKLPRDAWRPLADHPRLFNAKGQKLQLAISAPLLQIVPGEGAHDPAAQGAGMRALLSPAAAARGAHIVPLAQDLWQLILTPQALLDRLPALEAIPALPPAGLDELQRTLDAIPDLPWHSQVAGLKGNAELAPWPGTPSVQLDWQEGQLVVQLVTREGDLPPLPLGKGEAMVRQGIREYHYWQRDLAAEKAEAQRLRNQLPIGLPGNEWKLDGEQALTLVNALPELVDAGVVVHWHQDSARLKSLDEAALSLRIERRQDWFQVEGALALDEHQILDLRLILRQLTPGQRTVQLDEKTSLMLSDKLVERLTMLGAMLDTEQRINNKLAYPLARLLSAVTTAGDDAWHDLQQEWQQEVECAPELLTALRDYQKEGVRWMATLAHHGFGACLADDMGLGKTLQALMVLRMRQHLGPALVVVPKSVVTNWQEEVARFAPELEVVVFEHPAERATLIQQARAGQIILVNYGMLGSLSQALKSRHWASMVLDEAQQIKNAGTQRAKLLFQLDGDFRLALSGTPIENHLGELWSLFTFINPGLLGSLGEFKRRFGKAVKDPRHMAMLRAVISPFILRRLKQQVLTELPDKTEIIHHISLSPEERQLYEATRREVVQQVQSADGRALMHVLSGLTRLRRLCCSPQLVMPEWSQTSSKLDEAMNLLEEAIDGGHRVLVFSQFVDLLSLLRARIAQKQWDYCYLDGGCSAKSRQESILRFRHEAVPLFLISLKAGGTGLNLTQADTVLHLDPWWNPAVEDQASDRAHRMGQTQPVTVYRLVCEQTVEEKIVALHDEKRALADGLLSGQSEVKGLDVESLRALLMS